MVSNKIIFDARVAARIFHQSRMSGTRLEALPAEALPQSEAEAELVQDEVARFMGPVKAWKVGAASPQDTPNRAPIHAETLFVNPGRIEASMFSYIGAEAEIAYKFSRDLGGNGEALTRDEVLAAVESVHAAIEIIDTRFAALNSQPPLAHRADQGNHGALIIGEPIADWQSMRPEQQRVVLEINGVAASDKINGNSAGNPENLLVWLAQTGARSLGGIKAGQYVTTGSCSGTIMVEAPVRLKAMLVGRGEVDLIIDHNG